VTAIEVPQDWRELDIVEKARLYWRLTSRPKQLTPDEHCLCEDPDMCADIIRESWRHFPLKLQEPEREAFCLANGHVPWFIWLILAGRGWGKTRTGAEDTSEFMEENPGARVALVAPTFSDGRDTMVEGESGLIGIIPRSRIDTWNRSIGELLLVNGSRAKIFSAEEPERLRGPQHHRAWCDEIAAWRYIQKTWDMLMFGLRLGRTPRVVITTTPKPYRFVRKLVAEASDPRKKVVLTSGATSENERNLPATVIAKLNETYEGTRLGRQELNAEVLEDLGGGIISLADIERRRLDAFEINTSLTDRRLEKIGELMDRIVVGVDPAVTANKQSNETGIVIVGRSAGACPICVAAENPRRRPHAFVLEDVSGRQTDAEWAQQTVLAYRRWSADRVAAEVNNGGDLVESNLRGYDSSLPVKQVHATRGKVLRAEPIGAFYERGEVHHVGKFPMLEDQLCNLGVEPEDEEADPDGEASTSPDRADACVWALTELMIPGGTEASTVGTAQPDFGSDDR
jgi:phage terminase large subunit-like protein